MKKVVKSVWLGKSATGYLNLCFTFEDDSKFWIMHLNEYLNFEVLSYLLCWDHGSLDAFIGTTVDVVDDTDDGVISFDAKGWDKTTKHVTINVREIKKNVNERYHKMERALENLETSWRILVSSTFWIINRGVVTSLFLK